MNEMSSTKRKNMKPAERRNQLLDCAQSLFFTKGFEETSVANILAVAQISKGGFYHHFKSKDELLFGVLDRMAALVFARMAAVAEDKSSSATKRLLQFLHLRSDYLKTYDFAGQVEFFRVMNDDANMVLLERFRRSLKRASYPTLLDIITQGCADGDFTTSHPKTAAEMLITLGSFMDGALKVAIDARGTTHADVAARNLQAAMDMQFLTIDRVLGLHDGTTDFGWPEVVARTMAVPPIKRRKNADA